MPYGENDPNGFDVVCAQPSKVRATQLVWVPKVRIGWCVGPTEYNPVRVFSDTVRPSSQKNWGYAVPVGQIEAIWCTTVKPEPSC